MSGCHKYQHDTFIYKILIILNAVKQSQSCNQTLYHPEDPKGLSLHFLYNYYLASRPLPFSSSLFSFLSFLLLSFTLLLSFSIPTFLSSTLFFPSYFTIPFVCFPYRIFITTTITTTTAKSKQANLYRRFELIDRKCFTSFFHTSTL